VFIRELTPAELASLPPKHEAVTSGKKTVTRSVITELDLPPIGKIANLQSVFIDGANWEDNANYVVTEI